MRNPMIALLLCTACSPALAQSAYLSKSGDTASGTLGVAAGGSCDTSQWTGNVGGTSEPQPSCYATKMGTGINVPFPAVVGIASNGIDDQTHIQYAQHLVQATTSKGNSSQESGLVVNMISATGGGGAAQTPFNEKVGLYVPTLMIPGASNTWAFNPDLVINSGVGDYPGFVEELDMTNFNKDYVPGGTTSASTFRNFLSSYPVTSGEIWGATTASSSFTATTGNGSNSLTGISGNPPLVGEIVSGAGIPPYTYIVSISGSTAAMSNNATASASGVSLNANAFAVHDAFRLNGSNLVRDNTFNDQTNAHTSYFVAGSHFVGYDSSQGNLTYSMISAQNQKTCLDALDACWTYAGNNALQYTQNGGTPLQLLGANGGVNGVTLTSAATGFGPLVSAAGPDSNIPLNLQGKGLSPVQVLGGLTVTGNVQATVIAATNRFNEPLHTPSSSSEGCSQGDFVDDANYHYVCTAANHWKRVALSGF